MTDYGRFWKVVFPTTNLFHREAPGNRLTREEAKKIMMTTAEQAIEETLEVVELGEPTYAAVSQSVEEIG
jgi:hypothetical protein